MGAEGAGDWRGDGAFANAFLAEEDCTYDRSGNRRGKIREYGGGKREAFGDKFKEIEVISQKIKKAAFFKIFSNLEPFLFFAAILFLPTQLGRHFWPEFSYIYSLRVDYLSPTIYFWDLLNISLLVCWVAGVPKINKTAVLVFLFFLMSTLPSLFGAENFFGGFVRLWQYLMAGLFGVYIASRGKDFKKVLTTPLLLAFLYVGLLAVWEFLRGGSVGFWILGERNFSLSSPGVASFNFLGQVFLRPYSTFSHPNVLAGFLVSLLPFLIYLNQGSRGLLFQLTFLTTLLSVLFSFSRAALVVLFLEIVFLRRVKALALVIVLFATPLLFVRFNSIFNFDYLSITRRVDLGYSAAQLFWIEPLAGVGLNNFIGESAKLDLVTGSSRFLQPVHNIYLLVLSETGVLGMIGFLILTGFSFGAVTKKGGGFSKAVFLGWVSVLWLGFFDHYLLTLVQGQRVFFLIWGLGMLEYLDEPGRKNF